MSNMNELSLVIDELKKCGESLIQVSQSLKDIFSSEHEKEVIKKEKPKTEGKELALEDVRAVLADKSLKGHTEEIKKLLLKYGANKLSEIKPDDYEALLAETEVLGDD